VTLHAYRACESRNKILVRCLIKHEANINKENIEKKTLLLYACKIKKKMRF